MFIPTTREELKKLGWERLDVILVTGDSYIDSPFMGVAVVGKVLLDVGLRVGIIAQPDLDSDDIERLGEPRLFWGVTGGSVDSMVANRTASNKKRRRDDFTPGGVNDRRPDRAAIVYTNLIREHFKSTRPIVLGGIEASMRRIAHYDFWSDSVRRSILFDAKADFLIYGMAERSVVELAETLKNDGDTRSLRGLCYISREAPDGALELPSYNEAAEDKRAFTRMFNTFYENNDPITAATLAQKHETRYLVQTPPARYLTEEELDRVHGLSYERELHPFYANIGPVRALDTIRFSITTHRGCYGECAFCAISLHQGRMVRSRSKASILREAREMTNHPLFKGTIHDVGGPTANMYKIECEVNRKRGGCTDKRCLFPKACAVLPIDHSAQIELLRELRSIEGVKKVVVASGIRHDMVIDDCEHGEEYLREIVCHHVSGQMKIAPEHSETRVLEVMGKPDGGALKRFKELFFRLTSEADLEQYLTYYLIAAHPGCTEEDMRRLRRFAKEELGLLPEQVQIFTPTPSTYSTLIYWTGRDPFTGESCFVERSARGREAQKKVITGERKRSRR